MRICSIDGCSLKHYAENVCNKHYQRLFMAKETPEYAAWRNIKKRCYNPKDRSYHRYGARGIKMHSEWLHNYPEFLSYMGKRPSAHHSIDRIDNDGNYEPGNLKWSTIHQQQANRRCNNKTVGVSFDNKHSYWIAKLRVNNITVLYKRCRTYSDAVTLRKTAESKYTLEMEGAKS